MSKLHLEEEWRPFHGSMNFNILSGKHNGCPKGLCMAEECKTYVTYGEDGERLADCDYFKVGDLVRHYGRWDQPGQPVRITGSARADEHGIGFPVEGGYYWVYNMEKVEEEVEQ